MTDAERLKLKKYRLDAPPELGYYELTKINKGSNFGLTIHHNRRVWIHLNSYLHLIFADQLNLTAQEVMSTLKCFVLHKITVHQEENGHKVQHSMLHPDVEACEKAMTISLELMESHDFNTLYNLPEPVATDNNTRPVPDHQRIRAQYEEAQNRNVLKRSNLVHQGPHLLPHFIDAVRLSLAITGDVASSQLEPEIFLHSKHGLRARAMELAIVSMKEGQFVEIPLKLTSLDIHCTNKFSVKRALHGTGLLAALTILQNGYIKPAAQNSFDKETEQNYADTLARFRESPLCEDYMKKDPPPGVYTTTLCQTAAGYRANQIGHIGSSGYLSVDVVAAIEGGPMYRKPSYKNPDGVSINEQQRCWMDQVHIHAFRFFNHGATRDQDNRLKELRSESDLRIVETYMMDNFHTGLWKLSSTADGTRGIQI